MANKSEDQAFWDATERAEERFTGTADVTEFRDKMRNLGHDKATIDERIEDIHPGSLGRKS